MNFLTRNILFIHIFALVAAYGWIHGGTRGDLLMPVIPWLAGFILHWLLVFPQAKKTETLFEARSRVWHALGRDPLVYVTLILTLLLVIPFFNIAKAPFIDPILKQWVTPKPPIAWLPYCIKPNEHSVLLLWFPPVLVAALAVRHGLLKKSKRFLFEAICWNSGALAVLGFVQLYSGTSKLLWMTPLPDYFFSTFGYPNFAGAFFCLSAALSIGLWFQQVMEKAGLSMTTAFLPQPDQTVWFANRMAIPSFLALAAAIASLSRAAILLSVLVLVVLLVYVFTYSWRYLTMGGRITILTGFFAVIVLFAASFAFFKMEALKAEVRKITFSEIEDRVGDEGLYHKRIARDIFKNHPVFGVGGWGYTHYQQLYLTPEDKKKLQVVGGANVHNDTLQFLAEQGAVGFGMLVLSALCLVISPFWQAKKLCHMKVATELDGEVPSNKFGWLQRVPVPLVAVAIGALATVGHSLGDLPFRAPSVLIVWVLAWCCVSGWIPVTRRSREEAR